MSKSRSRSNSVSVVTGGSHGIGAAIVDLLCDRGDRVVVFDVAVPDSKNARALYMQVDVADRSSVLGAFKNVDELVCSHEDCHLALLVNNAGITRDTLALRMSQADWESVIAVNMTGTFFCSQQALRRMVKQRYGYIVTMSSVVGMTGNAGQANYAASKAGVIALTKSLAQEYGSRAITVNAIAPGFIDTDMTCQLPESVKLDILKRIALGRFGTVRDVAQLVLFLSSGQADYITGQVFEVSGGLF